MSINIVHYDKINNAMSKKIRNILLCIVAALVVGSCIFMFIISPFNIKKGNREMPEADGSTNEITTDVIIEQKFINHTENIKEVAVVFHRLYSLDETTYIVIQLLDGENVLIEDRYVADDIKGDHRTYLYTDNPLNGYIDKELTLRIYTTSTAGTGLSIMINSKDKNSSFMFGSIKSVGSLCFSIIGKE